MSEKPRNLNPLFSNSVTGLSLDDFTNRAILLPAAKKEDIAPIKREDSLENFSEISLDSSSVTDQPAVGYHHHLQSTDYLNNAPPQLDLNQKSSNSRGELVDAYGNFATSFSQLPAVASTVFSTFSSIIKGTSAQTDVNQNSGDQLQSPNAPKTTLDELYEQQQYGGGGGLVNPSPLLEGEDLILPPAPSQVAPTFFSPDDPLLTRGIAPNFAITETGGNAFRLGTNKKKLYAHVPGLTANQQQQQPSLPQPARVDSFPIPPIPQPAPPEPSQQVPHQVESYPQPAVDSNHQTSGQGRFSLTSFFQSPSQILEKIPRAASNFYQQTANPAPPVDEQTEFSGFGVGVPDQQVHSNQSFVAPPVAAFDPRNFNTRPIGEQTRPAAISTPQPLVATTEPVVVEADKPLPPPPTFFAPSQVPVIPKSSGITGSTNPYSSSKLSRGIVSYKNNSLIPLANAGPILIPGAEPKAQPTANFFQPTVSPFESQIIPAANSVTGFFQPQATTPADFATPQVVAPPPAFQPVPFVNHIPQVNSVTGFFEAPGTAPVNSNQTIFQPPPPAVLAVPFQQPFVGHQSPVSTINSPPGPIHSPSTNFEVPVKGPPAVFQTYSPTFGQEVLTGSSQSANIQEQKPELAAFLATTTEKIGFVPPPIGGFQPTPKPGPVSHGFQQAQNFFNPIVEQTPQNTDTTDVSGANPLDSFQFGAPQQANSFYNYFQRQSSADLQNFAIPASQNSSFVADNSCLADESLVVHASNTSLNASSYCSEIQNIFDKDQQQQLQQQTDFNNFNYTNTSTPSPPPFPTDNTGTVMENKSPNTQSLDASDALVKSGSTNIAYRPVYKHWFYKQVEDTKTQWLPFSMSDSLALEDASLVDQQIIATDGGRFDVQIRERIRTPVYWSRASNEVRRCSWFYKSVDSRFVPYEESVADRLEEEYKASSQSGNWHCKIDVNNGETVVFHGPSVMVHFLQSQNPDSWTSTPGASNRPRVVKRGCDEFNIDDGEPEKIDHLLFMVHGIGNACDLKFRAVEEVVDEFRSIAQQLVQSHYRTAFDQGDIGRVEVLPISWHDELHSEESGIDEKLKNITLESIPKLRAFTNDSILDVLFYTSPVFCQSIIDAVGNNINRAYTTFCKRNPTFNGGISLAGHSLGSLILFDLLCHQTATNQEEEKENLENPDAALSTSENDFTKRSLKRSTSQQISYTFGTTGTVGAPSIIYPQLQFHVTKFFAMGSPIGMFVTIRGVDKLGLNFHLPTCGGFFNIFHPYDPVAYRCEPLINPDLAELRPVLIKHHKGRKRMHLELKETIGRVSNDLKQKIYYTFRNALDVVYSITAPNKSEQRTIEMEVDKVLENQLNLDNPNKPADKDEQKRRDRTNSCSTQSLYSDMDGGETDLPLGLLNNYRRIDYVLQEAPLEFFNEYLFALTSHVCYWESEDTTLFVIKEIYASMGISTDSQIPQQTMTIERPISENFVDDEDDHILLAGGSSNHSSKR